MDILYSILKSIHQFGLLSNNYGSLVSGILVVIFTGTILFFIKDVLKKPPILTSTFYLSLRTEVSSYNPYIGLTSFYTLNIIDNGNNSITGRIEKTHDIENNAKRREYTGKNRNQGTVHGSIQRVYFGRNKLSILIEINGNLRASSIVINMPKINKKLMHGTFSTTAADSSGTAIMQNTKFI